MAFGEMIPNPHSEFFDAFKQFAEDEPILKYFNKALQSK